MTDQLGDFNRKYQGFLCHGGFYATSGIVCADVSPALQSIRYGWTIKEARQHNGQTFFLMEKSLEALYGKL